MYEIYDCCTKISVSIETLQAIPCGLLGFDFAEGRSLCEYRAWDLIRLIFGHRISYHSAHVPFRDWIHRGMHLL